MAQIATQFKIAVIGNAEIGERDIDIVQQDINLPVAVELLSIPARQVELGP